MRTLAVLAGVPLALAMLAVWLRARARRDADLLLKIRAGLWGGLWGTLGYDLARIPFHLAGHNPFPPIRAYGVWLSAVDLSTPWTDALGFLYHLSNGITFGWIYSLLFLRRHWLWAAAWGVLLETLAVATVFGEIFRLRAAYGALTLAYAAHLGYGIPLGLICRRPERPMRARAACAVFAAVGLWFLTAWQPLGTQPTLRAGEMVVGPAALYPGWTDRPLGSTWRIRSALDDPIRVKYRSPGAPLRASQEVSLPADGSATLVLDEPGIYQFGVIDRPWRSVFVSVQEDGRYRP